jgi:putative redox protein
MNSAQEKNRSPESASVALVEGMHFVGEVDGFRLDLDAEEGVGGKNAGARPMHLLLLGVAGCTAMDVASILRKKRQQVSELTAEVRGKRSDQHPRIYTNAEIIYRVRGKDVDSRAVERAIELSETKYCPAIAMLDQVAEISSTYEIEGEQ